MKKYICPLKTPIAPQVSFQKSFFFLFRNFYSEIFHSVESYHRNTPPSMSTCILSFLDLGFLNAVIEYSTPYFVSYINLLAHKELVFFPCSAVLHSLNA